MDDRATITIIDVDGDKRVSLDSLASSLRLNRLIIGTAEDAHIKVENPRVSPHHGYFYMQDGKWAYQDTNSTACSSTNGERISSSWLANGMMLVLDSEKNADSLVINVKVEITSGRDLLPGETPPDGWVEPSKAKTTFGGAFSSVYNGSGSAGMGMVNNQTASSADSYYTQNPSYGGASGGAGPRLGFVGSDRYENRAEPKFADSLNIFGMLSGILWGILGIVNGISVFRLFNRMDMFPSYISGFYKFLLWMVVLGVVATAVGSIMMAAGLFTYNKDIMSKGALVVAGGNTAIVVAILILLTESIGGAFIYIFSNFEIILMIIAIILLPISMFSQAKNFKENSESSKINSRWYRPILYYGIAILLVIIATLSLSNKFGVDISIFDLNPSNSNWLISVAWIAAVVLSGIYLHVDENPALATRFSMGGKKY